MEVGYDQASSVKAVFGTSKAFCDVEVYKDYAGIDRIIKANRDAVAREMETAPT